MKRTHLVADCPTLSPWKFRNPLSSCKGGHEMPSTKSGVASGQAPERLTGEAKAADQHLLLGYKSRIPPTGKGAHKGRENSDTGDHCG